MRQRQWNIRRGGGGFTQDNGSGKMSVLLTRKRSGSQWVAEPRRSKEGSATANGQGRRGGLGPARASTTTSLPPCTPGRARPFLRRRRARPSGPCPRAAPPTFPPPTLPCCAPGRKEWAVDVSALKFPWGLGREWTPAPPAPRRDAAPAEVLRRVDPGRAHRNPGRSTVGPDKPPNDRACEVGTVREAATRGRRGEGRARRGRDGGRAQGSRISEAAGLASAPAPPRRLGPAAQTGAAGGSSGDGGPWRERCAGGTLAPLLLSGFGANVGVYKWAESGGAGLLGRVRHRSRSGLD